MNNKHYEIIFINGMVVADYVSTTFNEVIGNLVKSTYFQDYEIKEIILVND